MKLADIRVGVPLLRLEVRIHHATPRKPTAFERIILSMAENLGQNPSFNKLSLERLFVEILCVPDPGPLVLPTLSELLSLDVISLRDQANLDRFDILTLHDIEITARGREMIWEGMLPAKTMQNEGVFYYAPISQTLLSESESKAYRPDPPKFSVDSSLFEGIFPEEKIRSKIFATGYRWLTAASFIERIELLSSQTFWKDTPCSIEINSGDLKIISKDEDLNSYLDSLEPEAVYSRFVSPVFGHQDLFFDRIAELGDENPDTQTIQQVLANWPINARFVIPGVLHDRETIPVQAPANQVIILYLENAFSGDLLIEWNDEKTGCKLWVNAPHPNPSSILSTDSEHLLCRKIDARFKNKTHPLGVVCRIPASKEDDYLKKPLSDISALVRSPENKIDQSVLVLWEGEYGFLEEQLARLEDSSMPIDAILQDFLSIVSDVERLNGGMDRDAWSRGLFKILCGRIASLKEIKVSYLETFFDKLATFGPYPSEITSGLLFLIANQVEKPRSLDEFLNLTSVLRRINHEWSPPYPSALLSEDVVKELIESFPSSLKPELLAIGGPLFDSLRILFQIYEKMAATIAPVRLMELETEDDYVALLKSATVSGLSDLSHAWANGMNTLLSVLQSKVLLEGTRLAKTNARIDEISRHCEKLIGIIGNGIQSVYVFDTSALIDRPQIVSEVRKNELFVVTKRVIEELDDKKRDETIRPKVTEVVRNLINLGEEHLHFCEGDMSLLPSDYRLKGDNLILSVALRYREQEPVLVTNDKSLSLKAKAEGLKTLTAEEFMKRPA